MKKRATLMNHGGAILRIALLRSQLQEQKDFGAAQAQAQQALSTRHRHEMAHISLADNPLGWAMAIHRYTRQHSEFKQIVQVTQRLLITRQQQERSDLERWIGQQEQAPDDEPFFLDQLSELLGWSLSQRALSSYHRALRKGHTLVITDATKSILWASRSFLAMTGYDPMEAVGKTPRFLQGPETDPGTLAFIQERLIRAQALTADLVNYRRNGDRYVCRLQIKPLFNRQGGLTHFIAEEHEVTRSVSKATKR